MLWLMATLSTTTTGSGMKNAIMKGTNRTRVSTMKRSPVPPLRPDSKAGDDGTNQEYNANYGCCCTGHSGNLHDLMRTIVPSRGLGQQRRKALPASQKSSYPVTASQMANVRYEMGVTVECA